jgi:hypothetical protein
MEIPDAHSLGGCNVTSAVLRLNGLDQFRNGFTSSLTETATFRPATQRLKHLLCRTVAV